MQSGIYEGCVQHRRFSPTTHAFRYRLWMMYLDLSELDHVFKGRWLWSAKRRALVRFRREDHLGDPQTSLEVAVRELVELRSGRRPAGPIRLLTQLRQFGYVMNPVCFYYCFAADGVTVEAVVAEVTNTPWGERHCYVLPFATATAGVLHFSHGKEFHVSPFMGMDLRYDWRIGTPGKRLSIHITNIHQDQRLFDATLLLERREVTGWKLARVLCRYPFMTGRIIAAIYWQAARLWWKRCPVFSHPQTHQQQEVTSL